MELMLDVSELVLTDVRDVLLTKDVSEIEVNAAGVAVVALEAVVPEVEVNVVDVAVVTVLRVTVAVLLEVIASLCASPV